MASVKASEGESVVPSSKIMLAEWVNTPEIDLSRSFIEKILVLNSSHRIRHSVERYAGGKGRCRGSNYFTRSGLVADNPQKLRAGSGRKELKDCR